jgi:hypothetical protein
MRRVIASLLALCAAACANKPSTTDEIQPQAPIDQISMYLVGFHPLKTNPLQAVEAHHYCSKISDQLTQCAIFDGPSSTARMSGIEYIIPESAFLSLPAAERQLWHPHNYEILSGQLVMPGLSDAAEHAQMQMLVNSYGKTWHTWNTGTTSGDPEPFGQPELAWSYNADGEVPAAMIQARDQALGVDSTKKRSARADLAALMHCQQGVNALAGAFPNRAQPTGVCDVDAAR